MNLVSGAASWRHAMLELGRWSVLLCLFSVPINKPATSIFIFLALVFSLAGPDLKERFLAAIRHPVVIGCLAWYGALLLSAAWAPEARGWGAIGPYKALWYPLIVATLLTTIQWRNRALLAFGVAATAVLALSWIQFPSLLWKHGLTLSGSADSFTVFKNYTQEGILFMVLGALAASFGHVQRPGKVKWLFWIVAAASLINVVFLLQSRTAYLIAIPLFLYWVWRLVSEKLRGMRGVVTAMVLVILAAGTALLAPRVQQRLFQAKLDVTQYAQTRTPTSMGVRLELWKQTLPIIAAAPVLGHGLGQWPDRYLEQVKNIPNNKSFQMGHPHQEALLFISELGFAGFAFFVFLMFLLTRYARRLEQPYKDMYTCLILIYVTAGLANCVLADFGHRHIFLMLLACIPLAAASEAAVIAGARLQQPVRPAR